MELKSSLNTARKSLLRSLIQTFGLTNRYYPKIGSLTNVKWILVCRPTHRLSHLLLIKPLIQEFTATYPKCKIDLFVKGGIAREIFRNYNTIDHIIQMPKKPFNQPVGYLKSWLKIRQKIHLWK